MFVLEVCNRKDIKNIKVEKFKRFINSAVFCYFNKTIPFFSQPEQTEGFCSMSRNSAPYRFISSTYNSVVTKLEGGNVNQIEVVHSANKACHNWMFVLIYRI